MFPYFFFFSNLLALFALFVLSFFFVSLLFFLPLFLSLPLYLLLSPSSSLLHSLYFSLSTSFFLSLTRSTLSHSIFLYFTYCLASSLLSIFSPPFLNLNVSPSSFHPLLRLLILLILSLHSFLTHTPTLPESLCFFFCTTLSLFFFPSLLISCSFYLSSFLFHSPPHSLFLPVCLSLIVSTLTHTPLTLMYY